MLGEIKNIPTFKSELGNLSVLEQDVDLPFKIRRVYFLHDVPGHAIRGGHGHKKLQQILIAVTGSFSVKLSDGLSETTHTLSDPQKALYLPPGLWRDLMDFSDGAVCLVLASEKFAEDDYIRDFETFKEWRAS